MRGKKGPENSNNGESNGDHNGTNLATLVICGCNEEAQMLSILCCGNPILGGGGGGQDSCPRLGPEYLLEGFRGGPQKSTNYSMV